MGRTTTRWRRSRPSRATSPPRESPPGCGSRSGASAVEAFATLDRGHREAALDALLDELPGADEETREDLRKAIVGILSELDPADPLGPKYRKRLAAALY